MLRAVKIKLYPNKQQAEMMDKTFGCCRYVYNWALEKKISHYNEHKKSLTRFDLSAELTKHKKEKEWLTEVYSQTLQQALIDLDAAFNMFFRKNSGFPKYKSKKHCKHSARYPQGFKINGKIIYIPKIGFISFKNKIDEHYDIRSITVSRKPTGTYWASLLYENGKMIPEPLPVKDETMLGIDLGITHYATFSDGTKIDNPKTLSKSLKSLEKAQQNLSKRIKDSNNHKKQKRKVARIYEMINNKRKDFLHKLVNGIVENQDYNSFAIEDLSIKSMMQNGQTHMSRSIGDASWYMFRQMLEYKSAECGKQVITIGKFDVSSKTCTCGIINHDLTLGDREWTCVSCSAKHDRDILAARNIKSFALTKIKNSWGAANKKEPT